MSASTDAMRNDPKVKWIGAHPGAPDANAPPTARGAPTPDELMARLNDTRMKRHPVAQPIISGEAAHRSLVTLRSARDAAAREHERQVEVCNGAETTVLVAQRSVDELAGVLDEVENDYADQMFRGEAPSLTPELEARVAAHQQAIRHLESVRGAERLIRASVAAAKFALDQTEAHVAQAVLHVLKGEGETIAERCARARQEFIEARQALMDLGAVNLIGQSIQCSEAWLAECREPVPEVNVTRSGVVEWNQRARDLTVTPTEDSSQRDRHANGGLTGVPVREI